MEDNAVKPCETPCQKCGSDDVYRRFYAKGEVIDHVGTRERFKAPVPRWCYSLEGVARWYAERELIHHHCRCCQHDWVDKPLPKTRRCLSAEQRR